MLMNENVISSKRDFTEGSAADEVELPLFDSSTMHYVTENFSEENKLGQGGFGCVYKASLTYFATEIARIAALILLVCIPLQ